MSTPSSRTHAHGRTGVIMLVVLMAVAAAVVVVHVLQRRAAAERAGNPVPAPTSVKSGSPVAVATMGHAQLLAQAKRALAEHRLLAPAGDNAFAYYLEARKRQPRNPVAASALRELYPFAVQSVEQTINDGHADEAQREIDLLDQADPSNYSLNILRAKLDAQRKLVQQVAASPRREPVSHVARHAQSVPAAAPAPPAVTIRTTPQASPPVPAAAPKPPPARVVQVAPPPVERTPPLLLRNVRPEYPRAARLAHRQGWVDVAYTVDPTGKVVNAHVVDAHPTHVFDIAALSAVRHWQFKPAQLDGHPVPQTVSSRIEFKL